MSLTHPVARGFKTRPNICCKNSKESVYSSSLRKSRKLSHNADPWLSLGPGRETPRWRTQSRVSAKHEFCLHQAADSAEQKVTSSNLETRAFQNLEGKKKKGEKGGLQSGRREAGPRLTVAFPWAPARKEGSGPMAHSGLPHEAEKRPDSVASLLANSALYRTSCYTCSLLRPLVFYPIVLNKPQEVHS